MKTTLRIICGILLVGLFSGCATWEAFKDDSSDAWEATKEVTGEVYDATKDAVSGN